MPLLVRVLVPVAFLIGALTMGGAYWAAQAETERTARDVEIDVTKARADIVAMLEVSDSLVTAQVQGAMKVLRDRAAPLGTPVLGPKVQVGSRNVPDLRLGGTSLSNQFDLVDKVHDLVGGTATVFVRDGDDFVRVSTNVIKDGARAIGTVLDPHGAAIASIRQGQAFYGMVDILGKPFLTGYEPLRDASGTVIGVWYVGYPLEMKVLEEHIGSTRILQSGYAAVFDRKDRLRFHSQHADPDSIAAQLADTRAWTTATTAFPAWGLRVVTAYPVQEVSALSHDRAVFVVEAGLAGCVVLILMLAVTLQRLVIRPLGGEPSYAHAVARRIASGDLAEGVRVKRGDTDSLLAALKAAQESVQAMSRDTQALVAAALEGRLQARADVTRHQGDYRQLVEGVNATLDAVMEPLSVAAECVAKLASGEVPPRIAAGYKGDFLTLATNLNGCIDALNALTEDATRLAAAAAGGQLSTRVDAGRHRGDYRRIVEGVNGTLDAVVSPLNEVRRVMVALAAGDLRPRIEGSYCGDFQVLQQATNASLDTLTALIGDLVGSAEAIHRASRDVAAGNTDLASRTEEQASSLKQTADSMEALTTTVRKNAESARQVSDVAHGAAEVAGQGGTYVRNVVVTMDAIRSKSQQIAEIIAVIDGIAFQTNILALNAAVEAARAGEQGRGFAVVSNEVRALAHRSAAAAREIRQLIGESVDTILNGSKIVAQAGTTMEELVAAVARVDSTIGQIALACDEQARAVEQVSTAIERMDSTTQENAALVEQSSVAASSLEEQAQHLSAAVTTFRIADATAPTTAGREASADKRLMAAGNGR